LTKECKFCGCELTDEEIAKYCDQSTEEEGIKIDTPICPVCALTKTKLGKAIPEKEREKFLEEWILRKLPHEPRAREANP
jgi:hypothetical protein